MHRRLSRLDLQGRRGRAEEVEEGTTDVTTCVSCGSSIPDGQGRSCSVCYGDAFYGSDGRLLAMMEADARRQEAAEEEARRRAEEDERP